MHTLDADTLVFRRIWNHRVSECESILVEITKVEIDAVIGKELTGARITCI